MMAWRGYLDAFLLALVLAAAIVVFYILAWPPA